MEQTSVSQNAAEIPQTKTITADELRAQRIRDRQTKRADRFDIFGRRVNNNSDIRNEAFKASLRGSRFVRRHG
jgi:hypothetical protein